MKLIISLALLLGFGIQTEAQKRQKQFGLAVTTTQSAMPFGKLAGMFSEQFHPGIEAQYGTNLSSRKNHDWFLEFRLGYFYHRYVQHGIPLYLNFGYRHKIGNKLSAETSLGAGYMHSIPATGKYKLNDEGEYVNNKGIGRMQAMATFSLGLGYTFRPTRAKPLTIVTSYQQRMQLPFVKSYVPMLPYNTLMIGFRKII